MFFSVVFPPCLIQCFKPCLPVRHHRPLCSSLSLSCLPARSSHCLAHFMAASGTKKVVKLLLGLPTFLFFALPYSSMSIY